MRWTAEASGCSQSLSPRGGPVTLHRGVSRRTATPCEVDRHLGLPLEAVVELERFVGFVTVGD